MADGSVCTAKQGVRLMKSSLARKITIYNSDIFTVETTGEIGEATEAPNTAPGVYLARLETLYASLMQTN